MMENLIANDISEGIAQARFHVKGPFHVSDDNRAPFGYKTRHGFDDEWTYHESGLTHSDAMAEIKRATAVRAVGAVIRGQGIDVESTHDLPKLTQWLHWRTPYPPTLTGTIREQIVEIVDIVEIEI